MCQRAFLSAENTLQRALHFPFSHERHTHPVGVSPLCYFYCWRSCSAHVQLPSMRWLLEHTRRCRRGGLLLRAPLSPSCRRHACGSVHGGSTLQRALLPSLRRTRQRRRENSQREEEGAENAIGEEGNSLATNVHVATFVQPYCILFSC